MTKEDYRQYLKSEHWQETRAKRLKIDKNRCYLCGTPKGLNVHHIRYNNLGNEDVKSDLVSLCYRCHSMLHRVKDSSRNEYYRAVRDERYGIPNAFKPLENRLKSLLIEEIWLRDSTFGGELPVFGDKMQTVNRMLKIVKILYPGISEANVKKDVKKKLEKADEAFSYSQKKQKKKKSTKSYSKGKKARGKHGPKNGK